MKYIYIFTLLIFYLAGSHLVQAHAVVTNSSLNVSSILAEQASQVELTFNSKIELNLSQVYLVRAGDKKQLLKVNEGHKPGHIVISIPSLSSGEYALQLKIFAVDGHFSENLVRFFVTEEVR